jgi:hypothetical protein
MIKALIDIKQSPPVISETVRLVLRVHGITLSEAVLREIGNNTAQALMVLDESITEEVA